MRIWRNWLEKQFMVAEGTEKIVARMANRITTSKKIENCF